MATRWTANRGRLVGLGHSHRRPECRWRIYSSVTTKSAMGWDERRKRSSTSPSFLRLVTVNSTFIAVHLHNNHFRNICWTCHRTEAGYSVRSEHWGFMSVYFSLSTGNHTLRVESGYREMWSSYVITPADELRVPNHHVGYQGDPLDLFSAHPPRLRSACRCMGHAVPGGNFILAFFH